MSSTTQTVLSVAVMSLVTAALRFAPFLCFKKKVPAFVDYLGKVLPYAIMGMLAVYCLKSVNFSALAHWLPALVATVLTVAAQVWKRNTIVSVLTGTVTYMILIRVC